MEDQLQGHLHHNATMQHQSAMNAAVEAEEYNLVALLNPRIFIDGNQWCVLYGENIQDGVCGFGDTPYKAVLDFNNRWNTQLDRVKQ